MWLLGGGVDLIILHFRTTSLLDQDSPLPKAVLHIACLAEERQAYRSGWFMVRYSECGYWPESQTLISSGWHWENNIASFFWHGLWPRSLPVRMLGIDSYIRALSIIHSRKWHKGFAICTQLPELVLTEYYQAQQSWPLSENMQELHFHHN
jgi:hypothetical protein